MKTLTYILSITLILILSSCGNQTQFSPVGTWTTTLEFDLSDADEMDVMAASLMSGLEETYIFNENGGGQLKQTVMGMNTSSDLTWSVLDDSLIVHSAPTGDTLRRSYYIDNNNNVFRVDDIMTQTLQRQ
jgi:hypothetical protein